MNEQSSSDLGDSLARRRREERRAVEEAGGGESEGFELAEEEEPSDSLYGEGDAEHKGD